ncbi:hypothetical protein HJFPF1_03524 [Paramyrothecium foliicola]|nr:hypothetical protein HJFPF1_03524 [Paramyrothecium foliicola]
MTLHHVHLETGISRRALVPSRDAECIYLADGSGIDNLPPGQETLGWARLGLWGEATLTAGNMEARFVSTDFTLPIPRVRGCLFKGKHRGWSDRLRCPCARGRARTIAVTGTRDRVGTVKEQRTGHGPMGMERRAVENARPDERCHSTGQGRAGQGMAWHSMAWQKRQRQGWLNHSLDPGGRGARVR